MSEASYVAEEEAPAPAPEGAPPGDESNLSTEERARILGWKPLEEYRGPAARFRSAEEFMRIGDGDNRILQEEVRRLTDRNRRLDGRLDSLEKTAQEQVAAIKALTDLARRADEHGYQRARAELLGQRKQAVETGDTSAFDQIEEQLGALDKARQEAPPPPAPAPAPRVVDRAIAAFLDENKDWFIPGSVLSKTMHAYTEIADQRYPDRTIAQRLAIAKRQVMDDFPERFPGHMAQQPVEELEGGELVPRRRAPSVATPASPQRRGVREPTGWDAIEDPQERADARAAFAAINRAAPDHDQMPEEEYLTLYNNPHADVLALRAARKKA